jgi:hypothetical protein
MRFPVYCRLMRAPFAIRLIKTRPINPVTVHSVGRLEKHMIDLQNQLQWCIEHTNNWVDALKL